MTFLYFNLFFLISNETSEETENTFYHSLIKDSTALEESLARDTSIEIKICGNLHIYPYNNHRILTILTFYGYLNKIGKRSCYCTSNRLCNCNNIYISIGTNLEPVSALSTYAYQNGLVINIKGNRYERYYQQYYCANYHLKYKSLDIYHMVHFRFQVPKDILTEYYFYKNALSFQYNKPHSRFIINNVHLTAAPDLRVSSVLGLLRKQRQCPLSPEGICNCGRYFVTIKGFDLPIDSNLVKIYSGINISVLNNSIEEYAQFSTCPYLLLKNFDVDKLLKWEPYTMQIWYWFLHLIWFLFRYTRPSWQEIYLKFYLIENKFINRNVNTPFENTFWVLGFIFGAFVAFFVDEFIFWLLPLALQLFEIVKFFLKFLVYDILVPINSSYAVLYEVYYAAFYWGFSFFIFIIFYSIRAYFLVFLKKLYKKLTKMKRNTWL